MKDQSKTKQARSESERTKVEQVLKEREERYWAILENIQEGYYEVDLAGNYIFFNPSMCKILGYTEEEMMGMNYRLYMDKETAKKVYRDFNEVYRTGILSRVDYEQIKKDGSKMFVETSVALMRDSSGQPTGFRGVVRDITERRQMEESLRESEGKYRNILENIEDGYFEVDRAGDFTFFNPSICRILGYPKEEMPGMNNRTFMDAENAKKVFQAFNEVYVTGIPKRGFEWEVIRKDGARTYIEVSISLMINPGEKPSGFRGIARDITERKRAEEAIVLAKNDWENTFDTVTDMITVHDGDFNIVRANLSAKAILGLRLQEGIPSEKCFSYYHGTEKPPSGCASCQSLQTGKPTAVEMFEPYLNKHLEIRAMPRFGSDGRLVGLIHVVRDITERKKAEERLKETLESLRKAFGATIQAMVSAVESRDPYTSGHQTRSADLARAIATEMRLPHEKIDGIRVAGSIHDIGKLSIPAEILSKPKKLSEIELSLIKEHARKGYEMLKDVESPWPLAEIVYQHHERIDGSGYPRNLKGDEILMEARILAVADVVEAMASHRPYRPGLGIDTALNEIEKNRGIYYDNTVADACLKLFREKGYQLEGT